MGSWDAPTTRTRCGPTSASGRANGRSMTSSARGRSSECALRPSSRWRTWRSRSSYALAASSSTSRIPAAGTLRQPGPSVSACTSRGGACGDPHRGSTSTSAEVFANVRATPPRPAAAARGRASTRDSDRSKEFASPTSVGSGPVLSVPCSSPILGPRSFGSSHKGAPTPRAGCRSFPSGWSTRSIAPATSISGTRGRRACS